MTATEPDIRAVLAQISAGIEATADEDEIEDVPPPKWPGGILQLQSSETVRLRPPPTYLVLDALPRGVVFQLVGPTDSFKSFVGLDLALSVANGIPWMGHGCTQRGRVVYIASEGSADLGVRIDAWLAAHPDEDDEDLAWSLEVGLNLLDDAVVAAIVDNLADANVDLVIFDTQQDHMIGGDENSAKDINRLVDALRKIQRATGAVVGIVHHTGWDDSRERGSSAQRGKFDVVLPVVRRTIACVKNKYGPRMEKLRFHMEPHEASIVPVLDVVPPTLSDLHTEVVADPIKALQDVAYDLVLNKPDFYNRSSLAKATGGRFVVAGQAVKEMVYPPPGGEVQLVEVKVPDVDKSGKPYQATRLRVRDDYDLKR
ncbi:AAA family ATPase [Geodermatophilus obscurus]|uniref:AAA domain-containing protein n=1 Tax=Geodermatophilus obscurus (strain ATCC 25078 / DSM 43160 / JCM 3152 / CCUG 61914 / KCC A-0152 / KCTC 9177 / NBRC 13315 / NRRL B-3577 / G-20) TaxID=526225 RepID=D2SC67_GEOOG|nr:AAA family ATPase [Geodermatophilus obscurus]ADB74235.1 hypothetical protein Gobs_1507 [Geodermatophilus obscurus DSM 43160]